MPASISLLPGLLNLNLDVSSSANSTAGVSPSLPDAILSLASLTSLSVVGAPFASLSLAQAALPSLLYLSVSSSNISGPFPDLSAMSSLTGLALQSLPSISGRVRGCLGNLRVTAETFSEGRLYTKVPQSKPSPIKDVANDAGHAQVAAAAASHQPGFIIGVRAAAPRKPLALAGPLFFFLKSAPRPCPPTALACSTLPTWIGQLTTLKALALTGTSLSGTPPTQLSNLVALNTLALTRFCVALDALATPRPSVCYVWPTRALGSWGRRAGSVLAGLSTDYSLFFSWPPAIRRCYLARLLQCWCRSPGSRISTA